jgi:hypothetical protein
MTANLEGLAQPPPDVEPAERRALVVAAHPDDADFGAAGTATLWSQHGWDFYYLVCTNGSKGSDDAAITRDQLISMRRGEQRAAAKILGVREVHFLDFEDGELTPSRELLSEIVRAIRTIRPSAVFTHDPEAVIVNEPVTASTSRSRSLKASSRTRSARSTSGVLSARTSRSTSRTSSNGRSRRWWRIRRSLKRASCVA